MLSLDLPTPTHFTEMRKRGVTDSSGGAGSSLAPVSPLMWRISLLTWHLQEVLDEPNVILCLRRKILEAPGRLRAAAPAGQRLVVHQNPRQHVHVCCREQPTLGCYLTTHFCSRRMKDFSTPGKLGRGCPSTL